MGRRAISAQVNRKLWILFKTECKARGIRIDSGLEGALIAGLARLGVQVPPELLDDEDELEVSKTQEGPSVKT